MSILFRTEHVDILFRNAEQSYPYEGCGLLVGRDEGDDRIIEHIVPLANECNTSVQGHRYFISMRQIFQARESAARQGLDVVGFFHSHPDHPEEPSDFDLNNALPWYTYVITSVQAGHAVATAAWRLASDRSRFSRQDLVWATCHT